MKQTTNVQKKGSTQEGVIAPGKQRSYNEIVDYLDQNWHTNIDDTALVVMKQLDKAFKNVSQKIKTVLIAGSNGKSLTAHFASRLLMQEKVSVGVFFSPHILNYNERFIIGSDAISNKIFTDIGNEVINAADLLGLKPNSYEILTMMGLIYFDNSKVDVAIFEVGNGGVADAVSICNPTIAAITRITGQDENATIEQNEPAIKVALSIVKPDTYVISADQSKFNLQAMEDITKAQGGVWSMPIRKLAQLQYPFEQLHGRCAALAERIAHVFINSFKENVDEQQTSSLLTQKKGHRGRPTLEAKRQSELNPNKTVSQFWKETLATLPGRFQMLEKEKPTILLDNASSLDAFQNIFLGIRLLHYKRPLKGLTVILGCNDPLLNLPEFLKLLRYFFKKTSGQIIVCPVDAAPGHKGGAAWDVEKVTNNIKSLKLKAKSAKSFKEAFEAAEKSVDERNGLVVITGSMSIISEYWQNKGIKKI